jgi:threonine/homoserine/homoserine lactone efflux protein
MTLQTWLLFVPACFALNMAFGPNNMLLLTNAARDGMGTALVASLGRLVAFTLMIAVAAIGLGAVLIASATVFLALKWAGALYLIWLGIKAFRRGIITAPTLPGAGAARTLGSLARQEFLVASGNPKAILIFTAFFPQFLDPHAYWWCFLIMGTTFLLLEAVAMALYAAAGARLKTLTGNARALTWLNRISGSMLILFGALLTLARRPAT